MQKRIKNGLGQISKGKQTMKANEIKEGEKYIAKVSNKIVVVRVDQIVKSGQRRYSTTCDTIRIIKGYTRYVVSNLNTGRELVFNSAGKFRKACNPNNLPAQNKEATKQIEDKKEPIDWDQV